MIYVLALRFVLLAQAVEQAGSRAEVRATELPS